MHVKECFWQCIFGGFCRTRELPWTDVGFQPLQRVPHLNKQSSRKSSHEWMPGQFLPTIYRLWTILFILQQRTFEVGKECRLPGNKSRAHLSHGEIILPLAEAQSSRPQNDLWRSSKDPSHGASMRRSKYISQMVRVLFYVQLRKVWRTSAERRKTDLSFYYRKDLFQWWWVDGFLHCRLLLWSTQEDFAA